MNPRRPPQPRLRVPVSNPGADSHELPAEAVEHAAPPHEPGQSESPGILGRRPALLLAAGIVGGGAISASAYAGYHQWQQRRSHDAHRALTVVGGTDAVTLTRATFSLALYAWAGSPAVNSSPALFSDLAGETAEQSAAFTWLGARGALWGDEDMRVVPSTPVTVADLRETMTALIPTIDLSALDGADDARASGTHLTQALEAAEVTLDA